MPYQLTISFDQASLTDIYANKQAITIVKNPLESPVPDDDVPPIAWLSVLPLERNLITWADDYALFATDTELRTGERLIVVDQTKSTVPFGADFTFAGSYLTAGPAIHFCNRQPGRLISFGLWQQATVNDRTAGGPISAVPVENNDWTRFVPKQTETVSIFLADASPKDGVVLSEIAGNALVLEVGVGTYAADIQYDKASGSFQLKDK